ncbi:hypothetical protein ccbrp13_55680 [Ktedonobacteria bacterium brp13]|nr:hypothetical protein ccbrp13_55680 [Ktedonobacteria bacterium brp13]
MAYSIGQDVGNYRLLKKIGAGGFAEVYRGEHIHLGTHEQDEYEGLQRKQSMMNL